MPSLTTLLGLIKPGVLEKYDVTQFNANADTIDTAMQTLITNAVNTTLGGTTGKVRLFVGKENVDLVASNNGTKDIAVSAGVFTDAPVILVVSTNSQYYGFTSSAGQTATNLRIGCARRDGTNVTTTLLMHYAAIQIVP